MEHGAENAIRLESWRQVPGFSGYLVSDLGRVMRIHPGRNTRPGKILTPCLRNTGEYPTVALRKNNRTFKRYVHALVLLAFVGKGSEGEEVNHRDGNKANNRVENLEYVTPSENRRHAYRLGLLNRGPRNQGVKHGNHKLTERQVESIRSLKGVLRQEDIADLFGVSRSTICHILGGRSWRHLKECRDEGE